MRKYLAFYRLRFERTLFYRGSVVLFRLSSILLLLTLSFVWLAAQAKGGNIGGYTKDGLVTYYLIGSIINAIVFWNTGPVIKEEIRTGELGPKTILKPISYYWQKFFEEFSWHTASLIFALISTGVAAVILRDYISFSPSLTDIVLALVSLFLASVLFFNISYDFGLLTFWVMETSGVFTVVWAGVFILGGQSIPLTFFPAAWRNIIDLLPFRYIYSFPLEISVGKVLPGQFVPGFAVQLFWIMAFAMLGNWLWKRGLKRYSAFGA